MKTRMIATHANVVRDSTWTLIQEDDGSLRVEQQVTYADGTAHRRTVDVNVFMREEGPPPRQLQTLIERMFDDA